MQEVKICILRNKTNTDRVLYRTSSFPVCLPLLGIEVIGSSGEPETSQTHTSNTPTNIFSPIHCEWMKTFTILTVLFGHDFLGLFVVLHPCCFAVLWTICILTVPQLPNPLVVVVVALYNTCSSAKTNTFDTS